ncbi:hypothetical protein SAMN05421839_13427 [Halolactibacillus halophilus]|jgi:hypothetical protein|uniref:Uncharacterized protein n=1 Tax=Halolactibacillus halophilus TaxID=306540 RepID=A0A1I5RTU5_9BACI|nr:hypothetical protein SAMN05421839_13427 [Halolactibacillus halophilus]
MGEDQRYINVKKKPTLKTEAAWLRAFNGY